MTTGFGPNRVVSGWILVASNASGSPYSPALVVSTATGITPFDFRLIGLSKLPGWMLIATGTMHSTVNEVVFVVVAGVRIGVGGAVGEMCS